MIVDATTLIHKSVDPILYDTVPSAIEELLRSGIKLGAIIGDNCPTQVLALTHWSPSNTFRNHPCPEIRAIRFFTCGEYSTALMLSDCLDKCQPLNRLVTSLDQLIKAVNSSPAEYIGHCPQPIEMRWLSRIDAIDWLFMHEYSLKLFPNRDDIELENRIRRNLRNIFQFSNFEEIMVLAKLIYPFHTMTMTLESDTATQSMILPLTEQMKKYFQSNESDTIFETALKRGFL